MLCLLLTGRSAKNVFVKLAAGSKGLSWHIPLVVHLPGELTGSFVGIKPIGCYITRESIGVGELICITWYKNGSRTS